MSTRQVLGAVGAAVGAYFFGPTGAQWGWAIGSAIGGAIDPEVIKGPSIGDIGEQTSTEGGPRPIIFALSPPMAGNIIESGPPRIVKKRESQGKGGPKVETESVYRTYAIGICEGPVGGLVRAWRNGKLVYDILDDSLNVPNSLHFINMDVPLPSENAAFLNKIRFFDGSFEQLPSPDLEAIFGVGTTPAHRGTAYMVVPDEDLTDLRGAIPQWMFQVQRCSVQDAQILALTSVATIDGQHQVMRSTDGENFDVVQTPVNAANVPGGFGWTGLVHGRSLGLIVAVNRNSDKFMSSPDGEIWTLIETGTGLIAWEGIAWSPSLGLFAALRVTIDAGSSQAIATSPDGINWTIRSTPSVFERARCITWVESTALFVAGQFGIGGGPDLIMTSPDGITWTMRSTPHGTPDQNVNAFAVNGLHILTANRGSGLAIHSEDGGITWAERAMWVDAGLADLALQTGDTPRCMGVSTFGGAYAENYGSFSTLTMPDTHWEGACYSETFGGFYATNQVGAGGANPRVCKMPDGSTTVSFMNTTLACDGGQWESVIAIDSGSAGECSFSVAQVVSEICERAGLPNSLIDVTDLEDLECRGFMLINSYPCFTALRSLSEVFLFDPAVFDGKVNFIRRGGNSVTTITEDDMLDDEADIEQAKRADAISIPRVLNLNYHDVAGGIATDKQTSERSGDRRSVGEANIQTAVMLNANEAARVAAINHKIMIEDQRGELKFCLPDSFIKLTPSNNAIIQWQGRSVRARIGKVDVNDGYQEYVCYHDRQSAYTSNVEGIPAAPHTPAPSSVIGPTIIHPLDIHILRDADDNVGLMYYVAVSGVLQAWQGALVELSMDGGANYTDSASTRISTTMGEIISTLPDHPAEFPDETHTVTVRIDTPFAELTETDLTGMMNGLNLAIIGDEIIQFASADEIIEGTWQLSLLLRGRKGTDSVAHAIGERFVLLDTSTLSVVPANLSDIGRALTFRATSFGTAVETGIVVTMTYAGRSQIEREPAYLMTHRDGTDAIVSWQGVGRLGSGATVAQGARFAGYRVTFDDGVLEEVVETVDQELTHDVTGFGSPISISVVQLNDLTGAGPSIEVILT